MKRGYCFTDEITVNIPHYERACVTLEVSDDDIRALKVVDEETGEELVLTEAEFNLAEAIAIKAYSEYACEVFA